MPSGGLPSSSTSAQQYADLWQQYQAARTTLAGMHAGEGPGGLGGASPGLDAAQLRVNQLAQQWNALQKQMIAANGPPPDGYHWGVLPDGSIHQEKNESFFDSTLGPFLALAGPALAFGGAALAGGTAAAGGGGGAASGTFGTAGMAGATGGLAAPAVIGAGGLAAAAPAVASGAAPVAGSTAAGVGAAAAGAGGIASKLIPAGLGLASTLVAGSEQGKANDFTQQAIDLAKQDYAGRQPFRDQALAALRAPLPQQQDRTALYADPSNPYSRYAPPRVMTGPLYNQAPPPVTP
jgi:hypothetical protein